MHNNQINVIATKSEIAKLSGKKLCSAINASSFDHAINRQQSGDLVFMRERRHAEYCRHSAGRCSMKYATLAFKRKGDWCDLCCSKDYHAVKVKPLFFAIICAHNQPYAAEHYSKRQRLVQELKKFPSILLNLSKMWSFQGGYYEEWSGVEWSGVEFATDGQSASWSWCRAARWGPWPDFNIPLLWHFIYYEDCSLLGYKTPVRTSQETHYFLLQSPAS
jgi:hypothetical protein